MTQIDDYDLYEQDFIEWLRRGRKSFELELIDDDHPGRGKQKGRDYDARN